MKEHVCPLCGGKKISGTTSFTADCKTGIVLIREVPATLCEQCGEEWIDDAVAAKLEQIVQTAKSQKQELFVSNYLNYSLVS